ncbi:MAG: 16S rRNA (uracil(1498)-N(3))-methyltransferase [Oligoflexia bacterium]|nr:16S rRNA (uracil(1498)-N(3))-methyltransferase [Oligoflexia bacterium]
MAQSRRVVVDCAQCHYGQEITPSPEDCHHLAHVLRLAEGAQVQLLCSRSGRSYTTIIARLKPTFALRVIEERSSTTPRSRVSHIAFALAKGDKNEFICEKACELGARNIILWQADHSVVKFKQADKEKKLLRFLKIIEAASKQSGNASPPKLWLLSNVDELCTLLHQQDKPPLALICSLAQNARDPKTLAQELPERLLAPIIGPEGDFSSNEELALQKFGALPMTLGPLTLRCETAAVAALASINALWGFERDCPESKE